MSIQYHMNNIDKAFSYQFQDKDWVKKVLLGSLAILSCMFIIPIPLVVGYYLQLQRNVMEKKKDIMPEWDNLDGYFMDGFKFMIAMLGYSLPWIILLFFMIIIAIIAAFIDEDLFAIVMVLFVFAFQVLMMIYGVLMLFITPVLYIKAAKRESWKEFYNFKEIWKFIKNNIGLILIITLLNWACGFLVNFGMLFFFIGIFPVGFYVGTIMAYLYGQLHLQAK